MGKSDLVAVGIIVVIFGTGFILGYLTHPETVEYLPVYGANPPDSQCYVQRFDDGPQLWQERIPTDMCWASLVGHLFEDQERSSRVLTTIELGTAPEATIILEYAAPDPSYRQIWSTESGELWYTDDLGNDCEIDLTDCVPRGTEETEP